jgi:hypothetical protein
MEIGMSDSDEHAELDNNEQFGGSPMADNFRTMLCVDGSASKPSKRPVYHVEVEDKRPPKIKRFRHRDGVLALLDKNVLDDLPTPILITVDVPLGLPADYAEVRKLNGGFLSWLSHRPGKDWRKLVVNSIAEQDARHPFVVFKKDEKKAEGKFPLRRCEELTKGESLYWCVGGKQVGKAALQFWHDALIPLRDEFQDKLAVWPFESTKRKSVIVAECYPAMLYDQIWRRRVTKTNPCDIVDAVLEKQREDLCVHVDDKTWLHGVSSEDEFDMLTVALDTAKVGGEQAKILSRQDLPVIKNVEGWMIFLDDPT